VQFVNQKYVDIADVNFCPGIPRSWRGLPERLPVGAKQYVGGAFRRFPDIHVQMEDLIAEDDRVVLRNDWTGRVPPPISAWHFAGLSFGG
jgi:hypothetical protein